MHLNFSVRLHLLYKSYLSNTKTPPLPSLAWSWCPLRGKRMFPRRWCHWPWPCAEIRPHEPQQTACPGPPSLSGRSPPPLCLNRSKTIKWLIWRHLYLFDFIYKILKNNCITLNEKCLLYIPLDLLTSVDWDTETSVTLCDLKYRMFNLVKW